MDWLLGPFADPAMARALAACVALAFGGAPIGVFLVLRRTSLIGDALSHSIVPGVAGAYMLGLPFALGAFFSGGLAAAANVVMGEGTESTPIAIISEADFVEFVDHDPTPEDVAATFVDKDEDLYAPFLNSVNWQRGAGGYDTIDR